MHDELMYPPSKKTAVIFGATGQCGSYLSELLLFKGYKVVGVRRRTSSNNCSRIEHINAPLLTDTPDEDFSVVDGDITDPSSVNSIVINNEPDEIYNLAAQSFVASSFEQPALTFDVNAGGTLNVLEAIRNFSPKTKMFQASTSEMFGSNYSVRDDEFKYQDELTPFCPKSPYAVSKVAAHHLVNNYRDAYGIFACCGITFNMESPRRGQEFVTRKITKWIGQYERFRRQHKFTFPLIKDDYIYMGGARFPKLRLGNLDAKRDWGYAKDYVKAFYLMLQQKNPIDYIISTGETHSIREFLDEAFKNVGINDWSNYVVIDPKFYRPSEVDYLLGDSVKIRTFLQWKPTITFEELVYHMVKHDIQTENKF